MRKLLISILLASAAASRAIAQDRGNHDDRPDRAEHQQAREQRQQVREERQQVREERSQAREQVRAERSGGGFQARQPQSDRAEQFQMRQQQQIQQQQVQRQAREFDSSRFQRGERAPQQVTEQQRTQRSYRGNRGGYGGVQPQQVEQAQRSGSWSRDRGSWSQNRDGDFRQRSGDQQHYRDRSRWASGGWNRDWRNDRHYDWRSYRDRHRSTFHVGVYFDPFGYSYRPFGIGYRLPQLYFGQRYWIDPGMYQLPYPPPGTQWVRYWNDAVLVDMYSGEVVDVIRDFFW